MNTKNFELYQECQFDGQEPTQKIFFIGENKEFKTSHFLIIEPGKLAPSSLFERFNLNFDEIVKKFNLKFVKHKDEFFIDGARLYNYLDRKFELYQKYSYFKEELILIKKDEETKTFYFLFKKENSNIPTAKIICKKQFFIDKDLDFDQIVKDLNLELDEDGNIKDYGWFYLTSLNFMYLKEINN